MSSGPTPLLTTGTEPSYLVVISSPLSVEEMRPNQNIYWFCMVPSLNV